MKHMLRIAVKTALNPALAVPETTKLQITNGKQKKAHVYVA